MWDRAYGSTTMILHTPGTTVPGAPPLPEYLRCAVYLPPSFLRFHPDAHQPIANIVQSYIESVGVPTVIKWKADASRHGWPLTWSGPAPQPNKPSDALIPAPQYSGSSHYIFRGRPALVASPPDAPASPEPSSRAALGGESPSSTQYGSDDVHECTDDALALLSAYEEIAAWQAEVEGLRSHLDEMGDLSRLLELSTEREERYLHQQVEFRARISELEAQLFEMQCSQGELSSSVPENLC
jgi:hypothetical protein